MKLKELYEKLYDRIFAIRLFQPILKIPGMKKLLEYEMISYLFFGVMTTVVNFVVTALCNALAGENYAEKILFNVFGFDFRWIYAVQAIAWIVSVLFSYVVTKFFVFDSRSRKFIVVLRELTEFIGSRIISFLLFEELLFGVTEKLLTGPMSSNAAFWTAKIASGILVIVFNYVASKLVIFRKKEEKKEEEP
ncbi:MAG: GtrA family protein [Clostridia bacterium]|nr:GtrA family protein [Clostridia bacterium]